MHISLPTASTNSWGCSAHHTVLRFLPSHRLACLLRVPGSLYSDPSRNFIWVEEARAANARPNIILPMSLRLWSLDPVTMFL